MKAALATLVLFVFAGTVYTQTGSPPPSGTVPKSPPSDGPRLEPFQVELPSAPKEPSIEQLIEQIVKVRQQKAALEKKEKDLTAMLRQKVGMQTELLNRLGLGDPYPHLVPAEPGRGRPFPNIPTPGTGPDIGPASAPGATAPPGSVPAPASAPAVGSPSPPRGAPGTAPLTRRCHSAGSSRCCTATNEPASRRAGHASWLAACDR